MLNQSPGVQLSWHIGAAEAGGSRHECIEREHVLIGLCRLDQVVSSDQVRQRLSGPDVLEYLQREAKEVSEFFSASSIDRAKLAHRLKQLVGRGRGAPPAPEDVIHRSNACRHAFTRAARYGREAGSDLVHCLHLLSALLEEPGPLIAQAALGVGSDVEALQRSARERLQRTSLNIAAAPADRPDDKGSVLARFGVDLVERAHAGKVDPLIGRRAELLKIARILGRRGRSNPLLLGEAGVGKTAIVRGLAWRIAQGTVVADLRDKRIIEIDVARVVAGTKHRGDFEERMTRLVAEATADPRVVLFIDEIHLLIGAGGPAGGMDAGNVLKPALASGDLSCIGSTTVQEYRLHIERDAALARRFQPVMVEEPSVPETVAVLEGLRERYEAHHRVTIAVPALRAAAELSQAYLPDRRLPDKAIELVDEACTHVKIGSVTFRAAPDGDQRVDTVTADTIAHVLSEWTGIPVAQLTEDDRVQLQLLAARLKRRVIGQDEAIDRIAGAVVMARSGLRDPRRPIGVFLLAGPTGTGKTEICRAVAEAVFGDERAMIRIDMSEYGERHTVARLIGAPPGYIGHDEEGQLTGPLRTRPHTLVLLDEIEKAHPDVLNLFLQLFDEGRLTDSRGHTVDGRHAIFAMTSNIPLGVRRAVHVGFARPAADPAVAEDEDHDRAVIRTVMTPEIVNRIDEVISFRALGTDDLSRIARKLLDELTRRALDQHVVLSFDEDVVACVVRQGTDGHSGARHLARAVERLVGRPLSRAMLSGSVKAGGRIAAVASGDTVVFVLDESTEREIPSR